MQIMAEAVVKATAGRVPVIIMIAAATVEESIELAKHAKEIGASGISSVVPFDKPNNLCMPCRLGYHAAHHDQLLPSNSGLRLVARLIFLFMYAW